MRFPIVRIEFWKRFEKTLKAWLRPCFPDCVSQPRDCSFESWIWPDWSNRPLENSFVYVAHKHGLFRFALVFGRLSERERESQRKHSPGRISDFCAFVGPG